MNSHAMSQVLEAAVVDGAVPGVAAIVGNASGTLYEAQFGVKDERGLPVERDTVFWIASLTKAVTTTAAGHDCANDDAPISACRWTRLGGCPVFERSDTRSRAALAVLPREYEERWLALRPK